MTLDLTMSGFIALYVFMLAAFAGWVIIGNVPAILHTPLMSGSNFVHGIVVVGDFTRYSTPAPGLIRRSGSSPCYSGPAMLPADTP